MQHQRSNWVNWVVLFVCASIGVGCSYLLVQSMKYGLALVGGTAGAALALIVCTAFNVKHPAAFWSILMVTALLFTLLTFVKNE
jgi:hypothetical protein